VPSIGIQELEALEEKLRRLKSECDEHHRQIEEGVLIVAEEIAKLKKRARAPPPKPKPPEPAGEVVPLG
jgi:hypothetical protein